MFRKIDLEQGSEEWKIWRKSRITATMPAVIMGKSPFMTPIELWRSICLGEEKPFYSRAAEEGTKHEEAARIYAEKALGVKIDKGPCIELIRESFLPANYTFQPAASLDGCIGLREKNGLWTCDAIVEIKCPGEKNFQAFRYCLPEYYWLQMQWQMFVAGVAYGYFVCFRNFEVYYHKVEATVDVGNIFGIVQNFQNHIDNFEEPPLSDADYPKYEDDAHAAKLRRRLQIATLIKDLKEEDEILKEELIVFIESTEHKRITLDGFRCSTYETQSVTYDNKKIYKDYNVDLEKYKNVGETHKQFKIGKRNQNEPE